MAKKPLIPVTPSSGNVFADIGVPEPEEELAKAQLASRIREIVRSSRLTQVAAAGVMGIDQPKVSALLNGRLSNFSSERLMRLLTRLGQDVEIVVKSKPRRRQRGRIRVVQEARAETASTVSSPRSSRCSRTSNDVAGSRSRRCDDVPRAASVMTVRSRHPRTGFIV